MLGGESEVAYLVDLRRKSFLLGLTLSQVLWANKRLLTIC